MDSEVKRYLQATANVITEQPVVTTPQLTDVASPRPIMLSKVPVIEEAENHDTEEVISQLLSKVRHRSIHPPGILY